ncbi:helix-turn-helix transcriptional regulator [Streptomyces plumbiresistens]|uniref:HTH cro/C1-type domain-containing protein n=1 Tax=Streptomyces plumbiresistens TaxID=511811 RepID=A0ABP7TK51_9ACTN
MTRSPGVAAPERPFADLAGHLTALREAARLPQRGLAKAANISRGAVQRAESGTAAPTLTVLDAYLRGCGAGEADRARARLLRTRGRTARRGKLGELKAPAPDFVHTKRELGLALAEVYERAGAPSLSDARLTPGRTPLPRTTAWRIVNRKGLPASREQLITFLAACGIRPAAQRPYLDAYEHVLAQRGTRRLPPGHVAEVVRVQRRQLTQRMIRRNHPVPLAHGGSDTDPRTDFTALVAGLTALTDPLADLADIDATALAPALTAFADAVPRIDVTAAAPVLTALTALTENVAAVGRLVNRDAHRNGTAAPAWTTAVSHIGNELSRALADRTFTTGTDDRGIDAITRTGDGRMAVLQVKSHRDRPGPGPALPGAPAPPPPRPAPAAHAC